MAIPPRRHPIRTFLETYPHVWYLLIWIVYLMLFWLAEHLIVDKYWVSHLPIDDQIPFCRFFMTRSPSAAISSSPTACGIRCCF